MLNSDTKYEICVQIHMLSSKNPNLFIYSAKAVQIYMKEPNAPISQKIKKFIHTPRYFFEKIRLKWLFLLHRTGPEPERASSSP